MLLSLPDLPFRFLPSFSGQFPLSPTPPVWFPPFSHNRYSPLLHLTPLPPSPAIPIGAILITFLEQAFLCFSCSSLPQVRPTCRYFLANVSVPVRYTYFPLLLGSFSLSVLLFWPFVSYFVCSQPHPSLAPHPCPSLSAPQDYLQILGIDLSDTHQSALGL